MGHGHSRGLDEPVVHAPAERPRTIRQAGARCNLQRIIVISIFPRIFFHSTEATSGVFVTPARTTRGRTRDPAEPMPLLFILACGPRDRGGAGKHWLDGMDTAGSGQGLDGRLAGKRTWQG